MIDKKYEPIIGLEIHVELKTRLKMFCQCRADYFGQEANTNLCPVCLALPGALPVPNKKAVEATIIISKALNCQVNNYFKFDRKHYFYPDLPKGYQISQYDQPVGQKGFLSIDGQKFAIERVHLEEDTGKLIHQKNRTLVDFNRAGVPLVEIVTEPVFKNSREVKTFLESLQTIIRYLDVSDADMEKGSMRLEPNISVRQISNSKTHTADKSKLPDYKVEVKNINSFRFVTKAIDYEIKRQTAILAEGKTPFQETRGFDDKKNITYLQRRKENANDYRYFPEPDIPPFYYSDEQIKRISVLIPELPVARADRFEKVYRLKRNDALILVKDKQKADKFELILKKIREKTKAISPQQLANLIVNKKVDQNQPVNSLVKEILKLKEPQKTDKTVLIKTINKIIEQNQKAVNDYKKGEKNALMFLVGQTMRKLGGKAKAVDVIKELKKRLG